MQQEVSIMSRRSSSDNPSCPHCQGRHVTKDGHKRGRQRWRCHQCARTFGPTFGTPLYRLRTPAAEVARSLLIVLRRGSLAAAEEITGHKYETIGRWLRRAGAHATALTNALVHDLHLTEVEVDAFWSFVKESASRLEHGQNHQAGWARGGVV
jgi:transposase-like protein